MKTIKKLLTVGIVCLLAVVGATVSHATTYYSSWYALGSGSYRGVGEFIGGQYVLYTGGLQLSGCTEKGTSVDNNVTYIVVTSKLSSPNNYDVPVTVKVGP